MFADAPAAIVYEVPATNFAVVEAQVTKEEREPISVQAFGQAPEYGVKEPNTIVYFYDKVTKTMNSKIIKARFAGINQQSHSSWALYWAGRSSVTTEFNLEADQIKEDLGLYLTHLSSDIHNGNYEAPIRIFVNGHILAEKYVPASHDWLFDDYFSLSELVKQNVLKPGKNQIRIALHENAISAYWIHKLMIK